MVSSLALGPPPSLSTLIDQGATALFLDFDGTLVALAPEPDAIEPLNGLAARLGSLSDRLEGRCAVVSGRGLSDIEMHIGPLPLAAAGSHGSDMRRADGSALGDGAIGLPEAIQTALRKYADQHALDYEHKPHGGALHYRANPEAGEAAHAFAQQLADQHGWAAQGGKCVVEIVARAANKGAAVRTFMRETPFARSRPFFVGDDLTDEAGFAACVDFGGAGILVGARARTGARYGLRDVDAVHEWLDL